MADSRILWPIESIKERAATDEDYSSLWRLHVDSMRPYVAATYGWVDAVQERLFRESWQEKVAQRVLVDEGVVVGGWLVVRRALGDRGRSHWCRHDPPGDDGQEDLFVAFVEVASSHQRRGIGTVIVRRALADAAVLRLPVRLTVMKANPDAQRLYNRLGFSVEGETLTHFRMMASP